MIYCTSKNRPMINAQLWSLNGRKVELMTVGANLPQGQVPLSPQVSRFPHFAPGEYLARIDPPRMSRLRPCPVCDPELAGESMRWS